MLQGLTYSAVFRQVAVTAVQDLFQLLAPADAVCVVTKCIITQTTDVGDAAAEHLSIMMHFGSTNGSGGSVPTIVPHQLGFPPAGAVIEANNTTQATDGNIIHAESMNIAVGWHFRPTPEEYIYVSPSDLFHVSLETAPADSITMDGTITWVEIGG